MAKKKSALLVVFAEKGLYNSFVPGEMGAKRKKSNRRNEYVHEF